MKVGIIGLGSIARKHIAALRSIDPYTQFWALRHRPGSPVTPGISDLYTLPDLVAVRPDFIIISNPTAAHYETINALASSGIPLFIEKPVFDSITHPLPQVQGMTYVACNLRFLDSLRWVKQHLTNRSINEVNVYCGSYLPEWRPQAPDWRKIYSANRDMGGGVHIDLIHEIDYVYWLFGAPQKVHKTFRNVSSLQIDAWDYANYCLEYPTFAVSIVLNYYRRDYRRTLEILLDDATWQVDLAKNTVCNLTTGQLLFESQQRFPETYEAQMHDFLHRMHTKHSEPFNTIAEAYDVLRICLE